MELLVYDQSALGSWIFRRWPTSVGLGRFAFANQFGMGLDVTHHFPWYGASLLHTKARVWQMTYSTWGRRVWRPSRACTITRATRVPDRLVHGHAGLLQSARIADRGAYRGYVVAHCIRSAALQKLLELAPPLVHSSAPFRRKSTCVKFSKTWLSGVSWTIGCLCTGEGATRGANHDI